MRKLQKGALFTSPHVELTHPARLSPPSRERGACGEAILGVFGKKGGEVRRDLGVAASPSRRAGDQVFAAPISPDLFMSEYSSSFLEDMIRSPRQSEEAASRNIAGSGKFLISPPCVFSPPSALDGPRGGPCGFHPSCPVPSSAQPSSATLSSRGPTLVANAHRFLPERVSQNTHQGKAHSIVSAGDGVAGGAKGAVQCGPKVVPPSLASLVLSLVRS